MFTSGYISLWRRILEWEWYDDINTTRLFTHLLLTVSFKSDKWHGIDVIRGSKVSSIEVLSKETNLTVRQVRTAIKHLEKTGELTRRKYPEFTVFTLVNYDKYQDTDQQESTNSPSVDHQESIKSPQYKKERRKERNNSTLSPLGDDGVITDMYDPNYDFGYIPKGKDF